MARVVQPPGWPRPKGYSNGMAASGELLAVAGQVGWDESEVMVGDDLPSQFIQALKNVVTVVRAAGGEPRHLISLTIFVTDKQEYLANTSVIGKAYREIIGSHYPAMALIEISGLIEAGGKVEIQALAVL